MLAAALLPYLTELQPADSRTAEEWIDIAEEIPSRKRQAYAACRAGKLPGKKVARRWLVRRSDLDAWIESYTPAKAKPAAQEDNISYLDGARERLGLRRAQ